MSYDLMVFNQAAAPTTRAEFLHWYTAQLAWPEAHAYDDPAVTTPALRSWLRDMTQFFPDRNGPATTEENELYWTGYTIGRHLIYIDFGWSIAEEAYETVYRLASKHQVGFFDVSEATLPAILVPRAGALRPIEETGLAIAVPKKPWWKIWL